MPLSRLLAVSTLITGIVALVLGIVGFMTTGPKPTDLGEAVYRSLQMFAGSFTDNGSPVGFWTLLGVARVLAIWSSLVVTITTVTALLGFSTDPWWTHKARRHVVIVGDRPELNVLATRIALPHLDATGLPRSDGWKAIHQDWPCGFRAPVVRILDPRSQSVRLPGVRHVNRSDAAAMRRALKDATRVVVGCVQPGDTIRTVRTVMESDTDTGATVHVLASNELQRPIEASSNNRTKPVSLDAFSIEGRAASLLFSKLRVQPEWTVLVVTPTGAVGTKFASALKSRSLAQSAAGTFGHIAVDSSARLASSFRAAVRVFLGRNTLPNPRLIVVVAGYPDSEVLDIERACKDQLGDISGVGRPAPVSFSWVVALITENRLGTVSDKSSISTAMILADPQDLAETTLMRVASRVAPKATNRAKVTQRLALTIRYLDGWYIERIPVDDPELTEHRVTRAIGQHGETRARGSSKSSIACYDQEALATELDTRADEEIGRLAADLKDLGGDEVATSNPSFEWFRDLLAVCGEPYRKRPTVRTTFESRLTQIAQDNWTEVDYAALDAATTDPSASRWPNTPKLSGPRRELVGKFAAKVATLLGCPGDTIPEAATISRDELAVPIALGRGSLRWWRPSALRQVADLLVVDDQEMNGGSDLKAFEIYYAALLVLECVPMALKPFGLALTDEDLTFSEALVWVGAQQVHGEYERRFGSKRDPDAFTTENWDQSRHSYRSDNFDGALRALSYLAFLDRFSDQDARELWKIRDRITNGDAGQAELQVVLSNGLPDPVTFATTTEHERWSIGKMQDRWLYGPRNDHFHLHPDLVPWSSLEDDQKIKDLNVVLTADRVRAAMLNDHTI